MSTFLLRHGYTLNNVMHITQSVHNDIGLTDEALEELDANTNDMLSMLQQRNVIILCSPMLRAKQTATALVSKLAMHKSCIQFSIMPELSEVDFGDFGDKHEKTAINGIDMTFYRKSTMRYYAEHVDFAFPNGETSNDIHNRCMRVIEVIQHAMQNVDTDIVIVGHNRLFRHLLVEVGQWQIDDMFKSKLPHAKLVELVMTE